MGCTIEVKVLGILKLRRKEYLVMDYMHSKGKIDLRNILTGTYLPTTLSGIGGPHCGCGKPLNSNY